MNKIQALLLLRRNPCEERVLFSWPILLGEDTLTIQSSQLPCHPEPSPLDERRAKTMFSS